MTERIITPADADRAGFSDSPELVRSDNPDFKSDDVLLAKPPDNHDETELDATHAPDTAPSIHTPPAAAEDGKIDPAYAYHKPSGKGRGAIGKIREAFTHLTAVLDEHVPESREKSLTKTHLENAAMWANRGVVVNDPESTIE